MLAGVQAAALRSPKISTGGAEEHSKHCCGAKCIFLEKGLRCRRSEYDAAYMASHKVNNCSPCARSEKRPRNEVSFHIPGNICFFALMGRKHDAEVEFTCCHSQKSAKVGFSKGFLSDLIGPDHVVDTFLGRPAWRRCQDETMVILCETVYEGVV